MKKRTMIERLVILLVLIVMIMVGMFGAVERAEALDYTVVLTTFIPTSHETNFGKGAFPNVAGGMKIERIIIANPGANVQTITIYDTATSSLTADIDGYIVAPVSNTIQVPFDYYDPLLIRNLAIIKSNTATACYATIIYR